MKRDAYYDTVKFSLICLVITGHVFEINRGSDKLTTSLYNFIYLFHMPLFIFLSGFFSKNTDFKKLIKGSLKLLETYIVFQIIFYSLTLFCKGSIPSFSDLSKILIQPYYALWYLISLVFWKVLMFVFRSVNKKMLVFLSILIGILIGYVQGIGYTLSLSKTIVYFPFFVLGYYCSNTIIEKIRSIPSFICIPILLLSIVLCYFFTDVDTYKLITGGRSYYDTGFSTSLSLAIRVIFYPVSVILSISFLSVIPSSQKIAMLGEKTLVFYIYHLFFLLIVSKLLSILHSNLIIDLAASIVITLCLVILSKFNFFNKILNPISLLKAKN
ncbi:acyltransferase family protein [Sphingobacterium multivorum]|uniref:acyltransferase family protein n=1 Tax=Sphingobacterium multivorum TaxID=28454 RepID=UPI003DA5561A